MNGLRTITSALGVAVAIYMTGHDLAAQQRAAVCGENEIAKGSLGYSGLECNCDFTYQKTDGAEGRFSYRFRSEPVILAVKSGGPADGKLRAGDVVTAIDGHLITTREGGRRFADPEVGRPLTLRVRREGREVDVQIVPEWECQRIEFAPPAAPAPEARPAPPARPVAPTAGVVARAVPEPSSVVVEAPVVVELAPAQPAPPARALGVAVPLAPRPPDILPKGELGFGISCKECKVDQEQGTGVPVWEFSTNPELTAVETGKPAYRAGMRSGDILTHINGHAMTSAEGGRLFGAIQPGDTVTFRFARNNTSREVQVVAEQRAWQRFDPADYSTAGVAERVYRGFAAEEIVTRFTGVVGDAHIVVTGGPITVSHTDTEVVIQSRDIVVKITKK
jgi:predicted metalloprotease with PDZ domain